MSHYVTTDNGNILVPIDKIIFTPAIIQAIKEWRTTLPKLKYKREFTAPLNRMNEMILVMESDVPLPPVELQPIGNTGYYDIINGRHRLAASVILGYSHIPAIIFYE